eukprot:c6051_g1_i2.p1 GENE.c6051_g1_i2~~c6051_g1_i2.p1  ORF type:complete len:394 (+),score=85.03 c6051_g1_i2:623-1804(+)
MDPLARKEAEHERAQRTVYVWQLPRNLTEKELREFFQQFGMKVTDVKLITDRVTRKFKGIAYVELAEMSMVNQAINVSGQLLRGRFPVMVKGSEAEKNFAAERAKAIMMSEVGMTTRVQVSQIHQAMSEHDLKELFSSFGEVESVRLQKNDLNHSKGFGYIHFKRPEDAKVAVQHLNDFEFGGQKIKVTLMPQSTLADAMAIAAGMNGRELDGIDGLNGLINSAESRAALMAKLQRADVSASPDASNTAALGAVLNIAASNPLLMQQMKLAGLAGVSPSSEQEEPRIPTSTLPVVYNPSPCLVLKNMFDPDSEDTEDGFTYKDIEEDVKEECSQFGDVLHIHALPRSTGVVFVKFRTASAAQSAKNKLHLRWFAKKQIIAEFVDAAAYNTMFS